MRLIKISWPLALVTAATYPGKDGLVRVVDFQVNGKSWIVSHSTSSSQRPRGWGEDVDTLRAPPEAETQTESQITLQEAHE